jgi:hypothetical protein
MEAPLDPRMKLDDDLRAEVDRIERQIRLFNWIAVGAVTLGVLLAVTAFAWLQPVDEISEAIVAAVGVASAFWALAGLFLLYVSFLGQRVDLVYNRQELRDTREQIEGQRLELARQAEQMEMQGETIGRQAFQGMFFQLLRRLGEMVSTLEVSSVAGEVVDGEAGAVPHVGTGLEAFRILLQALAVSFVEHPDDRLHEGERGAEDARDYLAHVYSEFFDEYGHFVGHYMETLRSTLQLIDQQGTEVDLSRRVYTDILSAQLSVPERVVLFYHCRTGVAHPQLRRLVEKYDLFEPLQPGHLLKEGHFDVLGVPWEPESSA